MGKTRLDLTSADYKLLKAFLYTKTDTSILFNPDWRSTKDLSLIIKDSWKRRKDRLKKLAALGLVEQVGIDRGTWMDRHWRINISGIYCVFVTLTKAEMLDFIKLNQELLPELSWLEKAVLKDDTGFQYLKMRIETMIKNYDYYFIEDFVRRWFAVNFKIGIQRIPPSNFQSIWEKYAKNKKMIEELSKIYGRIETGKNKKIKKSRKRVN